MNISVCITVFNEEKNIEKLLDGLLKQSKKPNEVVIVDAKSKDKTVKIIKRYSRQYKYIKLFHEPGSIAHGRNTGIRKSSGDIIVMTDAGCIPDKDWIKEITKPFKVNRDNLLVAGFYNMPYKTPFGEAAGVYLGIPAKRFDSKRFLPSARSVAFSKKVWSRIGGFDETLTRAGEDTKFFYECIKNNVQIFRNNKAIVEWFELTQIDLKTIAHKFFVYALGDGQANIWWHPEKQLSAHNIKISLVFVRYFVFLILLCLGVFKILSIYIFIILFLFYLLYSIWKWSDVIKNTETRLWLPVMQLISDIQVMRGFISGIIRK